MPSAWQSAAISETSVPGGERRHTVRTRSINGTTSESVSDDGAMYPSSGGPYRTDILYPLMVPTTNGLDSCGYRFNRNVRPSALPHRRVAHWLYLR